MCYYPEDWWKPEQNWFQPTQPSPYDISITEPLVKYSITIKRSDGTVEEYTAPSVEECRGLAGLD